MTVEDYFEKRIWNENKNHEQYEKVRKYMLNTLDSFSDNLDWFNNLSKEKRFELCEISCLISIHSQRQQLNETEIIFKKEKEFFKYSMDRPNSKYELITIDSQEIKKLT